jgi:hypothetical protein
MKTFRGVLLELVVLAVLVTTCALSFGQLTVRAAACEGLACTAQEDCGSKCFCNRPSGFCYLDQEEIE